jgi:hypothetical protein
MSIGIGLMEGGGGDREGEWPTSNTWPKLPSPTLRLTETTSLGSRVFGGTKISSTRSPYEKTAEMTGTFLRRVVAPCVREGWGRRRGQTGEGGEAVRPRGVPAARTGAWRIAWRIIWSCRLVMSGGARQRE